jgi:hypothetical protein
MGKNNTPLEWLWERFFRTRIAIPRIAVPEKSTKVAEVADNFASQAHN